MPAPETPASRVVPIRVLIGDLSASTHALVVQMIETAPDLVLVGEASGPVELLLAAAGVDVVLLGMPQTDTLPAVCSHLLSEYPDLKIVVLTSDGDSATLVWLGLRRWKLRHITPHNVAVGIRRIVRMNPVV